MLEGKTKVCTKCRNSKDLTLFPARKSSKDKRASWCRTCYKVNWDERYIKNHEHLRKSHNQSRQKIHEQNARKVFEYLIQNLCINCGEADPIVLEFDHREQFDKIESISNLIRDAAWEGIENEIKKCDVLCSTLR